MGKLEQDAKRLRRDAYTQRAILVTLSTVGFMAVALMAPKLLRLLNQKALNSIRFLDKTRTAATRLSKKGLVEFVKKDGKTYVRITDAGREVVNNLEEQEQQYVHIRKPRKWDKRWRLVVFDIPEERRALRNRLRDILITVGFVKIQNSVWVYPYDCEELVALIKSDMRIGRQVLYAVVETIENDLWLRKHFKLSSYT